MTASAKTRRTRRKSPASAVLRAHGSSVSEISKISGVDPATVSRQLIGDQEVSSRVHEAIVDAVGPVVAIKVIAAIPSPKRRAARPPRREPVLLETTVEVPVEPSLFDRVRRFVFGREEATS